MTKTMLEPVVHSYKIILKSWLHIGWSQDGLKIWGIDSEVVKNPLTWAPYIPGRSIKGKMRALLEMVDYSNDLKADKDGKMEIVSDPNSEVAKAFGCIEKGANGVKIASKLIFEDFVLTDEYQQKFEELKSDFFEDKAENSVPRFLSWTANPRHIERVPAGVEFEGRSVLVPEEGEYGLSLKELEKILNRGIELLEATFIGWGGSRGSGRISIEEIA